MNEKSKLLFERIELEEKNRAGEVSKDPWRLRFHLMPPVGWLNDPNGLCQYQGVYHVFFQYSPFSAEGAEKFWGHYTSRDLTEWTYEGAALVTDEAFDRDGVYSGSAYAENGKLYLFYTGNVKEPGSHDYILTGREGNVVMTESADGYHFEKKQLLLTNSQYPEDYTCHVRDPKVFQKEGMYWMVLGGRKKGDRGAALVYKSMDMKNWEYHTELGVSGDFGYMWECPDIFEMGGEQFLSVSPQGLLRGRYEAQNIYASGYFALDGDFRSGCGLKNFEEWDKGFDFYAPQTFLDETGRRILIGWAGLPDIGEEYGNPTVERGWQHALTVPRELTPKNGKVMQYPVPELEKQRGQKKEALLAKRQEAPAAFDLELLMEEKAGSLEIVIADGMRFTWDGKEAVLAFERPECGNTDIGKGRNVRRATVSGLTEVRILADTSLAEIYLNRGETVFTTRYYPDGSQNSLFIGGDVKRAVMWEMKERN